MRLLTLNFLTCAVKSCKGTDAAFPLHPRDAELATDDDMEYSSQAVLNMLPKLDWTALRTTALELGFPALPETPPTQEALERDEQKARELHQVLLETHVQEGKLVCGNCGHEYAVREGIANFLLPSHLV